MSKSWGQADFLYFCKGVMNGVTHQRVDVVTRVSMSRIHREMELLSSQDGQTADLSGHRVRY